MSLSTSASWREAAALGAKVDCSGSESTSQPRVYVCAPARHVILKGLKEFVKRCCNSFASVLGITDLVFWLIMVFS